MSSAVSHRIILPIEIIKLFNDLRKAFQLKNFHIVNSKICQELPLNPHSSVFTPIFVADVSHLIGPNISISFGIKKVRKATKPQNQVNVTRKGNISALQILANSNEMHICFAERANGTEYDAILNDGSIIFFDKITPISTIKFIGSMSNRVGN